VRAFASRRLVAGLGGEHSVAGVARVVADGAFLVRRGAGPTGNTQHLVSWTPAPEFVARDARCCGPLCVGIGVAVATSGRLVPDGSPLGVRSAIGIRDADSLSAHSSERVSPTEMLLTKAEVSDDGVAAPDCA
jgi:hypothetical protein